MKQLRALFQRVTGLFGSTSREQDLADELESHLQLHIDDNLRQGMSSAEARRQALLQLGGVEQTSQAYRERSTLPRLEEILQDLRFALRQLARNPGFTVTVIAVLSLGFGAAIAIFAFVDAALIKPLPYANPATLVSVYESMPTCPRCNVSYQNFLDWKKSNKVFSALEAWGYSSYQLSTPAGVQPVPGVRVTDGFFRTLGVTPILGRDFYSGESTPSAPHTVLIAYSTWKTRFNGDPNILGKPVTLSDTSYTIIGVLPPEFQFAPRGTAEFWATLHDPNSCEVRRTCHNLFGLARLRDGVSLQTAAVDVSAIVSQLALQYPDTNRDESSLILPLSESISGEIRPILLMLLGGAGLLLLIACVNISSLLLVRAESRRREMAVRSALGASRFRILRQFLTEGLLLVAVGSVFGLATAYGTMQLLLKLIPARMLGGMPYLQQLSLNPRVLAFAAILSLIAAILFSLTPALRLSKGNLQKDLSEGSRGSSGNLWRRFGSNLVVVELGIAMILLTGAGLLGKSLYRLLHVEIGMNSDHLATVHVTTSKAYSEDAKEMALERVIAARMQSIPGVQSVAIANELPVRSWDMSTRIKVAGRPWNGERNEVPERDVSPSYFTTLGATLARGRYFTDAENDPSKPAVAIINQAFAKVYFPGEDPIGRKISYALSKDTVEIVGLTEDIKQGELDSANRPILYRPFNQAMWASFDLIVRTSQAESALLPTMAAAIHQLDSRLSVSDAATMNELIQNSQPAYLHRASATLVGGFAAIAVLLSAVGLYGIIAYSVGQRSREIGVRIALGAQRSAVYNLILRDAGGLILLGIASGLLGSIAATSLMRKLLFSVEPWDVTTLASVSVLLATAALCASLIPAHRAASVNPVETLRAE